MPEVSLYLTDAELNKVHAYAQQHNLTDDQAASMLTSDGLAARYKKAFHRAPAQIYPMPKRSA